jgi:hypothetical protein
MKRLWLLAPALLGCGNHSSGWNGDGGVAPAISGLVSIDVTPANQTLILAGTTAVTSKYQASGKFQDGHSEDLTDRVSFSLGDPGLGAFSSDVFTSVTTRGGTTSVAATAGSVVGQTNLTVQLEQRYRDPASMGLPADPGAKFSGSPTASRAPDLVYPNDGVLVPPNLGLLEIHFKSGAMNTLFELSFANAATDIKVYLRCTLPLSGGCIYTPDATLWAWLSQTNRGGPPVTVGLRGTDDNGGALGESKTLAISFAADDVDGGLYYWTTSNNTAIMRYDFAGTQTAAQKFIGTELTGGTCVGCHALSRDGTKLVAEAGGQNDGRVLLLDVSTVQPMVPFAQPPKSIFESWNPDGSQYVGVYGDTGATDFSLQLFDGTTGMLVGPIANTGDAANPADHPDWSADGNSIVYVKVGIPNTLQRMFKGAIEVIQKSGAHWSMPVELVPAESGKNYYYPAFSPDGSFVVYNRSVCANGDQGEDCNGDSDPTARLFAISTQSGAHAVELARANAPGRTDQGSDLSTTFPKWCPFISRGRGELGSRLEWVTFSSSRNFGLRPPPPSSVPNGESPIGTLLWMTAIDPDQVAAGKDPSFPAFALPFQDLSTSNHIAQWTEKVVPPVM